MADDRYNNYPNPNQEKTVKVFDNFYNFEKFVPVNQYDVVRSYFQTVVDNNTATPATADTMAMGLFRIADIAEEDVMTLLEQIKGTNNLVELTATLAYYYNAIGDPSVLLGITATQTPNFYAARNVQI